MILRNGQGDDPGEAARDPALILGFKTSGIVEAADRQFYFRTIQTGDARPTGGAKQPLIALRAVPPNRIADQFDWSDLKTTNGKKAAAWAFWQVRQ